MENRVYSPVIPNDSLRQATVEDRAYYYYNTFVRYWDIKKINPQNNIKALFLKEGQAFAMAGFAEGEEINPNKLIEEAVRYNATSIVIGQQDINNELDSNRTAKKLLEKFKKEGLRFNIHIEDYLILSKWGYNSFSENELL